MATEKENTVRELTKELMNLQLTKRQLICKIKDQHRQILQLEKEKDILCKRLIEALTKV